MGILVPVKEPQTLPVDLRRELLERIGEVVSEHLESKGISEKEIIRDFKAWRKKSVGRIAADANVILSAITGKAALKVFTGSNIEVVSTSSTLAEVRDYIAVNGRKLWDRGGGFGSAASLLGIKEFKTEDLTPFLSEATRLIGRRDPDDIPLLALAMALNVPIWTNDKDFDITGIQCYSTGKLLQKAWIIEFSLNSIKQPIFNSTLIPIMVNNISACYNRLVISNGTL